MKTTFFGLYFCHSSMGLPLEYEILHQKTLLYHTVTNAVDTLNHVDTRYGSRV